MMSRITGSFIATVSGLHAGTRVFPTSLAPYLPQIPAAELQVLR